MLSPPCSSGKGSSIGDHLNVHRPIGWEYYVNKQFAGGIARWPQAELIDWDVIAHTRQEWFIEDQAQGLYYSNSRETRNSAVVHFLNSFDV